MVFTRNPLAELERPRPVAGSIDPRDRLPDAVKVKLELLQSEATDARGAAANAVAKMQALLQAEGYREEPDAALALRKDTLKARQTEAQARDRVWRDLMGNLTRFLERLANHQKPVKMFDRRLLPKRALETTVPEVREKIDALKAEITATKRAPLDSSAKRAAVKRHLQDLAVKSTPLVRFDGGDISIRLGNSPADSVHLFDSKPTHVMGLLVSLLGVEKVLATVMPPQAEVAGSLSDDARADKLETLFQKLLMTERVEESLIEASGTVLRRPDADPRAILGIEVA